jgi:hypothetical protein
MSYSQVFDVNGGYLMGYLGDINLLGAMVISDKEMPINKDTIVQIQLPELEGFPDETITIPVRIAWCHQDIAPIISISGLSSRKQQVNKKRSSRLSSKTMSFADKTQIIHNIQMN